MDGLIVFQHRQTSRWPEVWSREEGPARHARILYPSWSHARRGRVGNFGSDVRILQFYLPRSAKVAARLAGSDTTATAIRATILYITTNPRVYAKLLAEISSAAPSSPIQDAEARKLPYLQAVIKEGLRIFPPVTGLMTKDVPKGGDTINSLFIPEGTKIGYCAWGLFRDKKIWGEDSHVFRPERWLEGPREKIQLQESTLELVFGYGRWQCLGKSVALIELNKIFVEVRVQNRNFNMGTFTDSKLIASSSFRPYYY